MSIDNPFIGLRVKVGSTNRNAAGNQAIVGVGFKPKIVIIFATAPTADVYRAWGLGASDGTTQRNIRFVGDILDPVMTINLIEVRADTGPLTRLLGNLASFDADGFTITWAISGVITVNFIYICLG